MAITQPQALTFHTTGNTTMRLNTSPTVSIGQNTIHVVSHGQFPNIVGVLHNETSCANAQDFLHDVVSETNKILTEVDEAAPNITDDDGVNWRSRDSSYYNSYNSSIFSQMYIDVERDAYRGTVVLVARLEISVGSNTTITRTATVATVYDDKEYPLPKRMEALARLHNLNKPRVHFSGTTDAVANALLEGLGEELRDKLNMLAAIEQRVTRTDQNYYQLMQEQQQYFQDMRTTTSTMSDSISQLVNSRGKWDSV